MYEQYELELAAIFESLGSVVRTLPESDGEKRKGAKQYADQEIEEAERLLRKLENQTSRGFDVTNLRLRLDKLKRELVQAYNAAPSRDQARSHLLYGATEQGSEERSRLLGGNDALEKMNSALRSTLSKSNENNEMGTAVLGTLKVQRDQLVNIHSSVLQSSEDQLGRGRRILRVMEQRNITTTCILYLIIAVLVALIILVVVMKFVRHT
mmetsp:Transcript_5994/g.10268  ORF Transcript_5994/g.10268 Transcript_5994/m.10268 type:complete len:210 (-) Transcript_5994:254-883(-)|eukprot:CAMPEP_0196657668 /NCGR_PEP_ID=MMETSP1086-20130531/24793_1 /TAXON_ID=77921 /ORGANISM="Cyanoptyche  gloeocystis , Strain SAG4.97" /LENGTH=209 /DNA_ID=CAMNT_0041990879 /DNA_START=105 /DNA_END=734 /DNA_ORIENTATION=-